LYDLSTNQGSIIADVLSNAMVPQISTRLEICKIIYKLPILGHLMVDLEGIVLTPNADDVRHQVANKSGTYKVRSRILIHNRVIFPGLFPYSFLYRNGLVPPKTKVFKWLLLHDSICSKDVLVLRNWLVYRNASCSFCRTHLETSNHLLLRCI
jgi:hypothetical protein